MERVVEREVGLGVLQRPRGDDDRGEMYTKSSRFIVLCDDEFGGTPRRMTWNCPSSPNAASMLASLSVAATTRRILLFATNFVIHGI